jgi:hypothetical protein
MNETKTKKFVIDFINKQFEVVGVDLDYDRLVALNDETWYSKYTITVEQANELREWFIQEAKKRFYWSKKRALHEYSWLALSYGLKLMVTVNDSKE